MKTNPMRKQVFSLPDLLREQFDVLEARSRALLPTPTIFASREVILTGCGDSQIAGDLLRAEWQRLSGIPVRALNAMEAARYETNLPRQQFPQDPLVVAISVSGGVARTLEAAEQWRARGTTTVALTGNPRGPLGQATKYVYELDIPHVAGADGPGVRSFLLVAQALYLLAVRMGEVRGRYTQDEAAALRARWLESVSALESCLPPLDSALQQLAVEWQELKRYELLGSGPARAAAAFGAAKLLEASGHPSVHQDVEEWVHLHYFAHDPTDCGTWLLCSSDDPAYRRAQEIEPFLQRLGRPYRVLTDAQGASDFAGILSLPTPPSPLFTALIQCTALALFAAHLSESCGAEYGRGARAPGRIVLTAVRRDTPNASPYPS